MDKDDAYSETNYIYDVAQVRALRALAYFYMIQMWGDVPLITQSYDNGSFPEMKRTDAQIVLNYVEGELLAVAKLLPLQLGSSSDKYYDGDTSAWRGLLINRLSVYAMLAYVEAWKANYVDAEAYTAYVIKNIDTYIKGSPDYVTIANLVSPTGIFSQEYSNDYKAARLVTFGYRYGTDNANETGTDGHLESWTLAEPIIRKQLPEIYVPIDTLKNLFMSQFTTDNRFGYDELSKPMKYYSNYVTGLSREYPIFSK